MIVQYEIFCQAKYCIEMKSGIIQKGISLVLSNIVLLLTFPEMSKYCLPGVERPIFLSVLAYVHV